MIGRPNDGEWLIHDERRFPALTAVVAILLLLIGLLVMVGMVFSIIARRQIACSCGSREAM